MNKQQQIDQLAAQIIADGVGAELAAAATQLVIGNGNVDSEIVLIGEAPGKVEDEQGLAFVGASGRFLDTMLEAAGLSRDDVYITNIVKYRPPNNRDPSPAEKQAFWPYLRRQLEIIDPKAIVTLGRHSMEFFLPGAKIAEVHGQSLTETVEYQDGSQRVWQIVPLYHPAAALYNGRLRQTLIDDFKQVAKLAEA